MLSSVSLTCPVTALLVVDNGRVGDADLVCAGVGTYLRVYWINTQTTIKDGRTDNGIVAKLAQSMQVMEGTGRVVGIRQESTCDFTEFNEKRIAVFGCNRVMILTLSTRTTLKEENSVQLQASKVIHGRSDRILDVHFLADDRADLAIAYSHNYVELWKMDCDKALLKVLSVNCLLYSARIFGLTIESLCIAAGTVFSEIHVWHLPTIPSDSYDSKETFVVSDQLPRYKLVGHQGVIFGLDFGPDGKVIVSSSDDRSVRSWMLPPSDMGKDCTVIHPTQSMYGHTSRVWSLVFIRPDLVVSVGEDASCCCWNSNEGTLLRRFLGHEGKSIWSLAASGKHNFVVTGGGDGSIRIWPIDSLSLRSTVGRTELVAKFPSSSQETKPDFPRKVALLNEKIAFMLTDIGHLYMWRINENKVLWQGTYPKFAEKSVLTCGHGYCSMGNTNGHLMIVASCDNSKHVSWAGPAEPILDIKWYRGQEEAVHVSSSMEEKVLFSLTTGAVACWKWCTDNEEGKNLNRPEMCLRVLIPSNTIPQSLALDLKSNLLWVGDRNGILHAFDWTSHPTGSQPLLSTCVALRKRSLTCIKVLSEGMICVSDRNGYIKTFTYSQPLSERDLKEDACLKVTNKMDWIVDIITQDGEVTHVVGFEKNDFVCVNLHGNTNICRVSCGGGHRSWGFKYDNNDLEFNHTFSFISSKQVKAVSVSSLGQRAPLSQTALIQPGLHGREVAALLVVSGEEVLEGHLKSYLVTGGEDCHIRIISQLEHDILIELSHVKLSTTVKCLKRSNQFVFSGGGKGALCCWKFTMNKVNTEVTPRLVLVCKWPQTLRKFHNVTENDYRIMDIEVLRQDGYDYWLATANSDGVLRVFKFESKVRTLELLLESTQASRCPLSLSHVPRELLDYGLLLGAGTDGKISIWKTPFDKTEAFTKLFEISAHQSGINGLQVSKPHKPITGTNEFLVTIASCGDDNSFCCTTLRIQEDTIICLNQVMEPFAHASSITAIRMNDSCVISVSADSRLHVWRLHYNEEHIVSSLSKEQSVYLDVEDILALDVQFSSGNPNVPNNIVGVAGCGVQVWCG
eukprot:m.293873 g.293873  ORF g.293873 m.293873 type:complete len:1075 (+) comp16389_c0_seq36:109-3333(+)